MNKMKKMVGASIAGAIILAPVGTAFATMTAANVENFYNMPFTLTRINYKENYFGVIFRGGAQYLNMVALKPGYIEAEADKQYETMGATEEVEWGRSIFRVDVAGLPSYVETIVMARDGFTFYSDDYALIYYAIEMKDGSVYRGKISYAPCKSTFTGSMTDSKYECRIYYNEAKVKLEANSAEETYMSEQTKAKYTGGDEVLTSYAYRVELKSDPLTGMPADVKTFEQNRAEQIQQQEEAKIQAEQRAEEEARWQEMYQQQAADAAEIARLQEIIDAQEETEAAALESLRTELTTKITEKDVEIENLKAEITEKENASAQEIDDLKTKIAQREAELLTEIAEIKAAAEGELGLKTEEVATLEERLAELEKTKLAEINALKTQVSELEATKAAELAALKTDLAEVEAAKATEVATLEQKLLESETAREAERKSLEAKLAELQEKMQSEPVVQTQTVYVDREVVKEVAVEKDCEVTVADESDASEQELDKGDAVTDTDTAEAQEVTPELNQEVNKPWWILAPVTAIVGGLSYWWLSAEMKHKRKK